LAEGSIHRHIAGTDRHRYEQGRRRIKARYLEDKGRLYICKAKALNEAKRMYIPK
jgi:hypothetical protein